MTPEKALAILEGKVSHREQPRSDYDEKRIKNLPSGEMEITRDTDTVNSAKNDDFIRIFIIVLSGVGLVAFHLWRVDAVSGKFYKNGFNDGVASISGNLTSAQKDISDKVLQMDQLQQELSQAAQSLKETQESVPARIGAVTRRSDEKIKRLMDESQKKIDDLSGKLGSAQKDIDDKEKQLSGLQKALAQSEQDGDKVRKDLNNKLQQLNKLQQDLSRSKQAPAATGQPPHPVLPAVN